MSGTDRPGLPGREPVDVDDDDTDAPALGGGLGMNLGISEVANLMSNPSGISSMLKKESPTGDSPAEIMADVINMMRADVNALAKLHGVDEQVKMMSPDRAAQLLSGVVSGDGVEIVEVFNEEAARRDRVLREAMDEDAYEQFCRAKLGAMFTGGDRER